MQRSVTQKWRPPLTLVIGGTLAVVLGLPVLGIAWFKMAGNILGWLETAQLFAAVGIVATLVLAFLLWRLVLRPIRRLSDYAQAMREGRFAVPPPEHFGTQEFSALGRNVIDMAEALRGREAVLRSYADHATHELKGPLTVLRGAAELLDSPTLEPEDRSRLLARIDEAADRMTALLDAQRVLARAQEPLSRGQARISPFLPELQMEHSDLELTLEADAVLPLSADGLRLVLDHLLGNAAAHGATEVRIAATPGELRVSDNGPGVSPGNRDRIFDPFFTTRREAGGTGMGLPIVRRMLEAHGATIALEPEKGAVFVVRF
ncbi:HAMP domain-containing sensor histidine kinase [Flavimaricola marinus]|uniref:histidine kinase n=1 Tax=Flavimaricola marinus TaxID=1819565 RepID=A0A238LAZ7_9RHOB|nr:HAMP domain-containing sensor histidine kinase [Flavimaricola marinus]SMY06146.1 putative sensor histidine kinase TcrY [Flavimaricola marinus]